jgi:hypothetical protein
LKQSIKIQEEFIETERGKKNANPNDEKINMFVKACRMYNKGLACQKYLFKLLEEYVPA